MNANQALALFEGDPQAGYQEAAAILRTDRAELLAALKATTRLLEVSGMDDIGGGIAATIKAARVAIEKAEA